MVHSFRQSRTQTKCEPTVVKQAGQIDESYFFVQSVSDSTLDVTKIQLYPFLQTGKQ